MGRDAVIAVLGPLEVNAASTRLSPRDRVVLASADTSTLMLAGSEGSVFSWDLDPRAWLATACRLSGRDLTEQEWRSCLGERPYEPVCRA